MITSVIGRKFLKAYNEKFHTEYGAKEFFIEVYYPLFFDSNKYMQWVQNSPFVQMKKGQKVELLNDAERKEKLNELIKKVDSGVNDASVAIGYPASEEKEYATTSGQVSNIDLSITTDDVYLSWIGSSLGIGLQGGISILFDDEQILLDLFHGWELYRKALDANSMLKGNQINTWNGQWLSHKYDKLNYIESVPLANFNPFTTKDDSMSVNTQTWTKLLIGISTAYQKKSMMGYVYNFGQTNTTVGFISFELDQIYKPIELYIKFFGMDEGKKAEKLWGTAFGFARACQAGCIGVYAMKPKGLTEYMKGKVPKYDEQEDKIISFNTYLIWIMAMLNNEQLWAKAQEFANELQVYSLKGEKGKRVNSNKVDSIIGSTNKMNFIKNLTDIVSDAENKEQIVETAQVVHSMPSENVPYFLTLVRFHYAAINNTK
jgi:hypothetical protein